MGASDLHFSVGNKPVLRVNQDLVFLEDREIIVSEFMDALMLQFCKSDCTLRTPDILAISLNRLSIMAGTISQSFVLSSSPER